MENRFLLRRNHSAAVKTSTVQHVVSRVVLILSFNIHNDSIGFTARQANIEQHIVVYCSLIYAFGFYVLFVQFIRQVFNRMTANFDWRDVGFLNFCQLLRCHFAFGFFVDNELLNLIKSHIMKFWNAILSDKSRNGCTAKQAFASSIQVYLVIADGMPDGIKTSHVFIPPIL